MKLKLFLFFTFCVSSLVDSQNLQGPENPGTPGMQAGNYNSTCTECVDFKGVITSYVSTAGSKKTHYTYRYFNKCSFPVTIFWACPQPEGHSTKGGREIKPGKHEDFIYPCGPNGLQNLTCKSKNESGNKKEGTEGSQNPSSPAPDYECIKVIVKKNATSNGSMADGQYTIKNNCDYPLDVQLCYLNGPVNGEYNMNNHVFTLDGKKVKVVSAGSTGSTEKYNLSVKKPGDTKKFADCVMQTESKPLKPKKKAEPELKTANRPEAPIEAVFISGTYTCKGTNLKLEYLSSEILITYSNNKIYSYKKAGGPGDKKYVMEGNPNLYIVLSTESSFTNSNGYTFTLAK